MLYFRCGWHMHSRSDEFERSRDRADFIIPVPVHELIKEAEMFHRLPHCVVLRWDLFPLFIDTIHSFILPVHLPLADGSILLSGSIRGRKNGSYFVQRHARSFRRGWTTTMCILKLGEGLLMTPLTETKHGWDPLN